MIPENETNLEIERLQEQIDQLRAQVARQGARRPAWRGMALLAMGLLAGLATHAYTQPPPQSLVCRELHVVDENGKTIVYLGNNGKSADGKENGGYINVSTPEGQSSARLYTFADETSYFSLYSKGQWLWFAKGDSPQSWQQMLYYDNANVGKPKIDLSSGGGGGNGHLTLLDKDNNGKIYP